MFSLHDQKSEKVETFETPVWDDATIRECSGEVYFGATNPDPTILFEEFGFVPASNGNDSSIFDSLVQGDQSIHIDSSPILDIFEENIVFHENEYNQFAVSNIGRNSTMIKSTLPYALKCTNNINKSGGNDLNGTKNILLPKQIEPLRDITNISTAISDEVMNKKRAVEKSCHFNQPRMIKRGSENFRNLADSISLTTETIRSSDVEMRRLRFPDDLYTPRWVRGRGALREGLCERCSPGTWLKIKQSGYWYHMNFVHGISAASGRMYDSPIKVREASCDTFCGLGSMQAEALCSECEKWIPLAHRTQASQSTGNFIKLDETDFCLPDDQLVNANSRQLASWWRHAQKCHVHMHNGLTSASSSPPSVPHCLLKPIAMNNSGRRKS